MNVLGIMSGSSLDAVDFALVQFKETDQGHISHLILETDETSFPEEWKARLINLPNASAQDYIKTDIYRAHFIADLINERLQIWKHKIDFISWHGHTILHLPEDNITSQIGNGGVISAKTKIPTITDYRIQDITKKGEGTPLAPIVEKLLYPEYDYFLNIGGIANIGTHIDGISKGHDVCAANQVLNHFSKKLGLAYDIDGKIAESGSINETLLQKLKSISFHKKQAPKSIDNNWIQSVLIKNIENLELPTNDILRTFCEYIGWAVSLEITNNKIYCTGGGTFNHMVISCINKYNTAIIPEKNIVNFKESILMSLLGYLRVKQKDNVLASVTGAESNSSSGALYL